MARGSGGFSRRDEKTQRLIEVMRRHILTKERYFCIETGIEHRFGEQADVVHGMLYRSLGPTTDLLRYFPDSLYFDRLRRWPTWEQGRNQVQVLKQPARSEVTGLFTFFVEFKFSATERPRRIGNVPTPCIGQIEREAWLTYRRLTSPNPEVGLYLDGQRTRIALFYGASFAPELLYGGWEEWLEPIHIRKDLAAPGSRAVQTRGSGTPWINFGVRQLKPLARFLSEDLFWEDDEALAAVARCRSMLEGSK